MRHLERMIQIAILGLNMSQYKYVKILFLSFFITSTLSSQQDLNGGDSRSIEVNDAIEINTEIANVEVEKLELERREKEKTKDQPLPQPDLQTFNLMPEDQ